VILEYELSLLMPIIISSRSRTTTDNGYPLSTTVLEPILIMLDYQQLHICNISETVTDDNFELLQMIFSVVVLLSSTI
jgi:hypothetical protein